jgi:hypothetical protein
MPKLGDLSLAIVLPSVVVKSVMEGLGTENLLPFPNEQVLCAVLWFTTLW